VATNWQFDGGDGSPPPLDLYVIDKTMFNACK